MSSPDGVIRDARSSRTGSFATLASSLSAVGFVTLSSEETVFGLLLKPTLIRSCIGFLGLMMFYFGFVFDISYGRSVTAFFVLMINKKTRAAFQRDPCFYNLIVCDQTVRTARFLMLGVALQRLRQRRRRLQGRKEVLCPCIQISLPVKTFQASHPKECHSP